MTAENPGAGGVKHLFFCVAAAADRTSGAGESFPPPLIFALLQPSLEPTKVEPLQDSTLRVPSLGSVL
jgi:hypothetical protein